MSWQHTIEQALQQQHARQGWRMRTVHAAADRLPYLLINGQNQLNFAGNDYLGLSRHEAVIQAWQHGLSRYGAGSGASGHVVGYTEVHEALEAHLAQWLGYERALLFNSGYAANQALVQALARKDSVLLMDKLCHASLQEAAAQSDALVRRYGHCRHDVLARHLAQHGARNTLVATEGVFSMDGDQPDLLELRRLCDEHGAWLLVDDAHGIGVCGSEGRGSAAAAGIQADILVVTFGKAVGVAGAAVLCRHSTAEYLLQFARHLIYSTAMPPAQALALHEALHQVAKADAARAQLQANIYDFRQRFVSGSLGLLPSYTPIQPLLCGDNDAVLAAAAALQAQGLWVGAIRPPTVPIGQGRLRITLSAMHQSEHISALLAALEHLA